MPQRRASTIEKCQYVPAKIPQNSIWSCWKTRLNAQRVYQRLNQELQQLVNCSMGLNIVHQQLLFRSATVSSHWLQQPTFAANLLRRASVTPKERQRRTAGGRRWLRNYLNGCAFKVFDSPLSPSLAKVPFAEAAEWLYRTSGFVLMGERFFRFLRRSLQCIAIRSRTKRQALSHPDGLC